MNLTQQQINQFKEVVLDYSATHGRDLPWRRTIEPYAIMVSEVMLQQTQVPRVIEKYIQWIRRFPSVFELSAATLDEILPFWVGLGYNRRALYLKKAADYVVEKCRGIFPSSPKALGKLPGIGLYTARAICVFAYNQPHVLVETNTRTVFIHHFFANADVIEDEQIVPLIEQTMDSGNPRLWFNALFDYGSYLKAQFPNPTRKSTHYVKQSPLKGSVREVRGWIIKRMSNGKRLEMTEVKNAFPNSSVRIRKALLGLIKDELLSENFGMEEAGES